MVTSRVGRNCVIFLASHKCYRKGVREMGTEKQGDWGRDKKDYSSIEKGEKDTAVLRVIKAARDCVGDRLEENSDRGVRSFS